MLTPLTGAVDGAKAVEARIPQDVLRGLVAGASSQQIARELGIGPRMAELHRAQVMSRLNARSMSDAVRIGIYAGLDGVKVHPRESPALRPVSLEQVPLARRSA